MRYFVAAHRAPAPVRNLGAGRARSFDNRSGRAAAGRSAAGRKRLPPQKRSRNPTASSQADPLGAAHAAPPAGSATRSRDGRHDLSNAPFDQPRRRSTRVRITRRWRIARRWRLASAIHFPIINAA